MAIVTLLARLLCFAMALVVARAHAKTGILAPAMTADAYLERCNRAHTNTLEWMPIFLPAMWLFAIYWSPMWASLFGSAWIVGRILYFRGYIVSPPKRAPGFLIQVMAVFALSVPGGGWRTGNIPALDGGVSQPFSGKARARSHGSSNWRFPRKVRRRSLAPVLRTSHPPRRLVRRSQSTRSES